jgi:hypothetical protein
LRIFRRAIRRIFFILHVSSQVRGFAATRPDFISVPRFAPQS